MHAYRTHTCGALRDSDVGQNVRLSGWVHRKRDHGGVLFVDLRDHYGLTQIVCKANSEALAGIPAEDLEILINSLTTLKANLAHACATAAAHKRASNA